MQTDRRAQRSSQIRTLWRCRPHALAIFALALLITAPLAHSAWAQGSLAPAPAQPSAPAVAAPVIQPAAPAAQSTAPAAPSAAMPSAATPSAATQNAVAPSAPSSAPPTPAANATAPNPQANPGNTANPAVATPPVAPAPGEPSVGGELLPQKLSFERMYLDADRVVKAVMIGLALASLVTWTVFLAKTVELRKARSAVRRGLRVLLNAATLAQAHDQLREDFKPGRAVDAGGRAGNPLVRQRTRRRIEGAHLLAA